MKNLFNDLSQQEKQRILEMHGIRRDLISEETMGEGDFVPYCTECDKPEIKCQKGKLIPQTINEYAAKLKTEIEKPTGAGIAIGQLLGGKFKAVIDIFENLKAAGGNFHDYCALNTEYRRMHPNTLCEDLGRIKKRSEIAELKGIIDSLEKVPCKTQTTVPPKKRVSKRTSKRSQGKTDRPMNPTFPRM